MKRLLAMLTFALAVFGQDQVKKLTTEDLKRLMSDKIFFLDVRTPKEIEELGTLKGYINIPIDELAKRMNEIPKDSKAITACGHGVRASKAAAMLQAKGYRVLGACGIEGVDKQGIPLVYPKAKS